jgi:hypothetical protein
VIIRLDPGEINKPPAPRRACGACSMCCKLLAIHDPALAKPANVWCPHVQKGCGCTIYARRPAPCVSFECLWLASAHAPPGLRPDRIHGLMTSTPDGTGIVVHEDPGWPGHAHQALRPLLAQWIADGTRYYVVACGQERVRRFFGHPALLPTATTMLNQTLDGDMAERVTPKETTT